MTVVSFTSLKKQKSFDKTVAETTQQTHNPRKDNRRTKVKKPNLANIPNVTATLTGSSLGVVTKHHANVKTYTHHGGGLETRY